MMNALNFTCALILTLMLLTTPLASSAKLFFTDEELTEMGVHFGPISIEKEAAPA